MKKVSQFLFLLLLFAGCTAPKQIATTQQTFTFDYTPKESAKPGSAVMTLAIIKPNYASDFASGGTELFKRFRSALGDDIDELIIAKGFAMKGPYASFDEMVFDDKKTTDIAIRIEIVPEFTSVQGGWKEHTSILGANYTSYTYSGQASLIGKINLTGIEPLTNEKIWSKSVSIPNVENLMIETSAKYSHPLTANEMLQDAAVYNVLGKALQEQYAGIMDKIAAHFNVQEFGSLKAQIKELKAKKGF